MDLTARAIQTDAVELASRLCWATQQTRQHLLGLLWSMRLLTRQAAGYQTAPEMQPYLCRSGERFIGDSWRYRHQSLTRVGRQLPDLLKTSPGAAPAFARVYCATS